MIIASTLVALNGLIYQPRKNPNSPPSWSNINRTGKTLFCIILLLAAMSIIQTIYNNLNKQKEIYDLVQSQKELKETNNQLIRVVSVADGYNALIDGVVEFNKPMSENKVREALQNLFLKYVEIEIGAQNKLGLYTGRVDYGAHPEVRKFLRMNSNGMSYSFEIRCSKLKILNAQKMQYARMSQSERIYAKVKVFEWYSDYQRLYGVRRIEIRNLTIEELDRLPINQTIGVDVTGQILRPLDNSRVPRIFIVEGVTSGNNQHLWPMVHIDEHYWPIEKMVDQNNGSWRGRVITPHMAIPFEVSIVSVSEETHHRILGWLQQGSRTGQYTPVRVVDLSNAIILDHKSYYSTE
jgi:hypothetical protein